MVTSVSVAAALLACPAAASAATDMFLKWATLGAIDRRQAQRRDRRARLVVGRSRTTPPRPGYRRHEQRRTARADGQRHARQLIADTRAYCRSSSILNWNP